MRVINAMFGRKKGDIEQSFIDYTNQLSTLGCEVEILTYQDANIAKSFPPGVRVNTITNFGQWDPVASWKLKKLIRELKPDIIVAHGNRASSLLSKSIIDTVVVCVCHNYNAKLLAECKMVITISEDLRKLLIKKGVPSNKIYTVPISVNLPDIKDKRKLFSQEVPVIGASGKFITKRGFIFFLRALAMLKDKGIEFKAILAGDGPEKQAMKSLAASLQIDHMVQFTDELLNPKEFYSAIDVFCLPSLQEPFGSVILEAFSYGVAVVTTDTEGPIEIVTPHVDALVVEAGEDYALADAFEKLIKNPKFAERIAESGYHKVANFYNNRVIGKKIYSTLEKIISEHAIHTEEFVKEESVLV